MGCPDCITVFGQLASPLVCHTLDLNSFFFTARTDSFHKSVSTATIRCGGLRKERRITLWRNSDVLSRESINAVHYLKLSKRKSTDPNDAEEKLGRLLKADVLNVFAELKRQNQVQMVLLEVWDEPDAALHCDVIQLLGDNKMIAEAEKLRSCAPFECRVMQFQPLLCSFSQGGGDRSTSFEMQRKTRSSTDISSEAFRRRFGELINILRQQTRSLPNACCLNHSRLDV